MIFINFETLATKYEPTTTTKKKKKKKTTTAFEARLDILFENCCSKNSQKLGQ